MLSVICKILIGPLPSNITGDNGICTCLAGLPPAVSFYTSEHFVHWKGHRDSPSPCLRGAMPLPCPPQVRPVKNNMHQEYLRVLCHTSFFLSSNLKSLKVIISLADLQVDFLKGCKFWCFYWSTQARSRGIPSREVYQDMSFSLLAFSRE